MIALIQVTGDDQFNRDAEDKGKDNGDQHREGKGAEQGVQGYAKIGAHHVERAVRQIDEIHDAEHQRQSGGEKKQKNAEVKAG